MNQAARTISRWLLAGTIGAALVSGCATVLGDYSVLDDDGGLGAGGGAPAPACSTNADCDDDTQCDDGYCRIPCLDKADCKFTYSICSSGHCSEHIGTSCQTDEDCGGLDCVEVDNRNEAAAPYCSWSCSTTLDCPRDYECISRECRVIGGGGPLCYVPTDGPCSRCMLLNCDDDVQDCCGYSSPCAALFDTVDGCDAARTYDACNPLYNESTSSSLPSCISDNCEGDCWNPCPGDDC